MDDMILRLIRLKGKGYCCAQILVILALEAQGRTNTELVRSLGGLCFGVNGSGEVCGALSGGVCLISLYTGKGDDEEHEDPQHMAMIGALSAWFSEKIGQECGGIRCDEILERFPDRSVCGQIVSDTYRKCLDILISRGFDPAAVKNGRSDGIDPSQ